MKWVGIKGDKMLYRDDYIEEIGAMLESAVSCLRHYHEMYGWDDTENENSLEYWATEILKEYDSEIPPHE